VRAKRLLAALLAPAVLALGVLATVPAGASALAPRAAQALPPLGALFGWKISTATVSHFEAMIFGALIVFFLIVEPHGLARLWSVAKEKLRLWPFPH